MSIKEIITKFRISNCQRKIDYYKNKYCNLSDDIVTNRRARILGFKRLRYCNNKLSYTMPFAFYEPKNEKNIKLPLIIYLHGLANGGESNIIPFFGGFPFAFRLTKNIKKNPCYIIMPSIPITETYVTVKDEKQKLDNSNCFDSLFTNLFEKIKNNYPIDENRVYVVGSSDGAMGTYTQIKMHKERYAAAIPMMGAIFENDKSIYNDLMNIPLWVAHSKNDKVVPITEFTENNFKWNGTDIIVSTLKEKYKKNIKYTKYKYFGHRTSFIFMIKENWIDWIFKQSKNQ